MMHFLDSIFKGCFLTTAILSHNLYTLKPLDAQAEQSVLSACHVGADSFAFETQAEWMFSQPATLELTHNWGTESDPEFKGCASAHVS